MAIVMSTPPGPRVSWTPLFGSFEVDDDAVAILHLGPASSLDESRTSLGRRIAAAELLDVFEIVHLAGGFHAVNPEIDKTEAGVFCWKIPSMVV